MARTRWTALARSRALEPGMAALLAASTGFALHAMPSPMLESLVGGAGLPGLIAAAAPPLGETARIAIVAAGAVAAFAAGWGVFRLIDLWPQRRPADPDTIIDIVPRRVDAHPDAPSRRPIFAAADLGNPVARVPVFETPVEAPVVPDEAPGEGDTLLILDDFYVLPTDEPAAPPPAIMPEPAPAPAAAPVARDTAALMARLEAGLARRAAQVEVPPRGKAARG